MTSTLPNESTTSPAPEEADDLGFGRLVAQQARGRFFSRDGHPTSRKYGLGAQRAERFYLNALSARWPQFLLWMLGVVLLVNGAFALLYMALGPDALHGTEALGLSDPFMRAFAFSVGVFTTVGTGPIYAVGSTATWVWILESLVGLLSIVASAGLLIARLTRPRMSIRFSESAVIAPYEGGRGFMFRMVNERPGELSDVKVRVNLIWFEDFDGVRERNFHQLELERDSVAFLNLHWTVVHPITATSPLRGMTPESLAATEAEFVIQVSAHEETFSTRVTSRASYFVDEIRWDAKFASIFANGPDGIIAIDVERLSRLEHLAEGATATPAPLESLASTAAKSGSA